MICKLVNLCVCVCVCVCVCCLLLAGLLRNSLAGLLLPGERGLLGLASALLGSGRYARLESLLAARHADLSLWICNGRRLMCKKDKHDECNYIRSQSSSLNHRLTAIANAISCALASALLVQVCPVVVSDILLRLFRSVQEGGYRRPDRCIHSRPLVCPYFACFFCLCVCLCFERFFRFNVVSSMSHHGGSFVHDHQTCKPARHTHTLMNVNAGHSFCKRTDPVEAGPSTATSRLDPPLRACPGGFDTSTRNTAAVLASRPRSTPSRKQPSPTRTSSRPLDSSFEPTRAGPWPPPSL